MMMKEKRAVRVAGRGREHILSFFIFFFVLILFLWGLNQAELRREQEALLAVENDIRRAVVSCYAIEGRYPQNLDYIERNYGVRIDQEEYIVSYEIFSSNIIPQITIQKREQDTRR